MSVSGFVLTVCSSIFTKLYLSTSLPHFTTWTQPLLVPALFFGDVLLLILVFGVIAAVPCSRLGQYRSVLVTALVIQMLLAMLVVFLDSALISYYRATSAILDWQVVIDFAKDFASVWQLAARNSSPLYFFLLAHLVLAALIWTVYQRVCAKPLKGYLPLGSSQPSFTPRFILRRVMFAAAALVAIYGVWAYRSMPRVDNWQKVSQPVLVAFGEAVFRNFIYDYHRPVRMRAGDFGRLKTCETVADTFELLLKGQRACPPPIRPDFSFMRRQAHSKGIKNVMIVFLESARRDLFPLDSSSPWLQDILSERALSENPITPFFSRLVRRGLYFEHVRTVSTFTLKSMLGTFCSVIPMHTNHFTEWNRESYRKCLPQLLHENGWSTYHLQAGSSEWDHQRDHLFRMGFLEAVGVEEIEEGFIGKRILEKMETKVNYFGGDDMSLIGPMVEWMLAQSSQGKPFLLSTITNVNHDPYYWPADWPAYKFTRRLVDMKVQRYLNTVRYTDAYLSVLVRTMRKRRLLDDTLLVIMGDHGMALGEHQRVGTNENAAECLTRIPLFFYSDNPEWRQQHPPRSIKKPATNLDVLPTILDMLNEDDKVPLEIFTRYYEGSSLVRNTQRSPIQVSLINPGAHAIALFEGPRKAVFKQLEDTTLYNLDKDPAETSPQTDNDLQDPRDRAWSKKITDLCAIMLTKLDDFWAAAAPGDAHD